MHKFLGAAALLLMLLATHSVSAPFAVAQDDERPDWGGGYNTWRESSPGDWVRYALGSRAGARFEAVELLEHQVKYRHTNYRGTGDSKEDVTSDREFTRNYDRAPRPASLPYGINVEWRRETFRLGELRIPCDVASWVNSDGADGELWFSRHVPCGGVVQMIAAGEVSVRLIAMHSESFGSGEGKGEADTVELPDLPEFFLSVGNYAVLKISMAGQPDRYQRREVTAISADGATVTASLANSEGVALPNMPANSLVQSAEDWKKNYGEPKAKDVELEVPAGKFTCDHIEHADGEEWVYNGATVKRVVRRGGIETTLTLVKLSIQERKSEDEKGEE